MPQEIYLISGHTSSGGLKPIDARAIETAPNNEVTVVNLSFEDPEKLQKKAEFFNGYFRELGADHVHIIGQDTSQNDIDELFDQSGLIYLPGGHTETLIDEMWLRGLDSRISEFGGVLAGNLAGNYAMCNDYLKLRDGEQPKIIPAFGLANLWTKAHYEDKFDKDLLELSRGRYIVGLANNSAIIYTDDEYKMIGDVWVFNEGLKEKRHWIPK